MSFNALGFKFIGGGVPSAEATHDSAIAAGREAVHGRTARTKEFSQAEKDVVLRAVELTADEFAKGLSGLAFARVGAGAPSDEAADYSSDRHTIRCFDDAFAIRNVWFRGQRTGRGLRGGVFAVHG